MKVLYVSDLDGTLLNMDQKLDEKTCMEINGLINNGLNFTISTGRGESAKEVIKNINFKYPIMLLNGTINYDMAKKEYINKKSMPNNVVLNILQSLQGFKYKKFEIQVIVNNEVKRYPSNNWDEKSECLSLNILHNTEDSKKLEEILNNIKGINFFIHKRVYSQGESYCDIVLENLSKASSLKEFKEKYKFDKIIAFGDSENDLPLAKVADEFYAVGNAASIVKEKATGIIGKNTDNGVVQFMMENYSIKA